MDFLTKICFRHPHEYRNLFPVNEAMKSGGYFAVVIWDFYFSIVIDLNSFRLIDNPYIIMKNPIVTEISAIFTIPV